MGGERKTQGMRENGGFGKGPSKDLGHGISKSRGTTFRNAVPQNEKNGGAKGGEAPPFPVHGIQGGGEDAEIVWA
jgi:hypothetical protein